MGIPSNRSPIFDTNPAVLCPCSKSRLKRINSSSMPELPDIVVCLEALERRILGRCLIRCRISSPFVLRSAGVPLAELEGRGVLGLRRLGKRIVIRFEDDLAAVIHLM